MRRRERLVEFGRLHAGQSCAQFRNLRGRAGRNLTVLDSPSRHADNSLPSPSSRESDISLGIIILEPREREPYEYEKAGEHRIACGAASAWTSIRLTFGLETRGLVDNPSLGKLRVQMDAAPDDTCG